MGDSYSRRYPRLALPALPRPDLAGFWRSRRAVPLAALAPALALLLVLAGGLLAVDQHARFKAEVRRAETGRYLAEFREAPVADAWARLADAWQAEQGRQRALLARVRNASGERFEVAVRNYRDFVLDTVQDRRLAADIERYAAISSASGCASGSAAATRRPRPRSSGPRSGSSATSTTTI